MGAKLHHNQIVKDHECTRHPGAPSRNRTDVPSLRRRYLPARRSVLIVFSGTGENRTHIVRFKRPMHYLVCHNPKISCESRVASLEISHSRLIPQDSLPLLPKSSHPDWSHQKRPDLRQHRLNRCPLPHGQGSLRPSFSSSCLSPWTIRSPHLTCVSDGKPRRRLLMGSKAVVFVVLVFVSHWSAPF